MIRKKEIHQWKLDEVVHLVDLFKNNKTVAVIEVARLNDKQMRESNNKNVKKEASTKGHRTA